MIWSKDDYQEHKLGYLDGIRIEFERLGYSHAQEHDVNEFYSNLDIAFEWLWQLIGVCDEDWDRYPLETSCDELPCTLHPLPNADSSMFVGTGVLQREPELA